MAEDTNQPIARATKKSFDLSNLTSGFSSLPLVRQLGLLLGLSASIALGFAVVLWAKEPNFRPLYDHLNPEDTTEILDALHQAGIEYKLDTRNGTVLIPAKKLYDARLQLASVGLPKNTNIGFEFLDKDQSIGTSRFIESARYRRALEAELARTISSIKGVRSARVHLALPKESIFLNDHRSPSASIFVELAGGHTLDKGQVSAIVQMVASSIPNMKSNNVTLVDQNGNLLTTDENSNIAKSKAEFAYEQEVEKEYEKRIESMLTPLLGVNKVRARVSASMDFTRHEIAEEKYNPKEQVVRSEKSIEEQTSGSSGGGVPGALSNSAPQGGGDKAEASGSSSKRTSSTKNFEVGKTVSYKQTPIGVLEHLSVAVIVDNHSKFNEKTGKITSTPLSDDELQKITTLVKNAIGFDKKRGDKVNVINQAFATPPPIEKLPDPAFYEQAWFWEILKMSGGGLFVLLLVFGIIRPMMRNLISKAPEKTEPTIDPQIAAALAASGGQMPNMQQSAPAAGKVLLTSNPQLVKQHQTQWHNIKQMASDEPTKVASIMKTWVGDE